MPKNKILICIGFSIEKSYPWFINLTDIQVPDSVQNILRLGKGFSSNMINDKSKQMLEIVKDSSNFELSLISDSAFLPFIY